ncbi:inovirus Gp2 family protein [Edwardsiella piscicida]|uniref:inovirus Gp2 family protein n=2 Tax=Edwardsiella piscicida TaxID=1263550 RepID=UPI00370D8CBB
MVRVELKCQSDFSDIALVFNHLLDSFELELREKVRLVRRVLSMHHLMFTVLTLTGFRGVLNYRSTTSLKSQLREEHKRSGRAGKPSPFGYIWARERVTGERPHYHLVLLFNKDVYGYLGDYSKPDADNMGTRIQKAWCSAIGLEYPYYASRVEFPENHSAWFTRQDALTLSPDYYDFLLRVAYMAKEYSKDFHDGYRNFGTSQLLV